jgi:hypothetical protein
MKKWMAIATAALTLGVAQSASAGWNDSWGNGSSDYPTWTPMYWMDEMFNTFDNNDFGGGNSPWGWNRGNRGGYNNGYYPQQGYGYPQGGYQQPYGYSPYGYAPQPQQQQAPAYQQSPYGYMPYGYAPQQNVPAAPVNR